MPTNSNERDLQSHSMTVYDALDKVREQQQLVAWNITRRDYSYDACVPQLVAQQAAVRSESTALVVDGQRLSYGELNRRANQLAHYLQMLGVRPNVLVGLFLERSIDMVVALLGILKAGGAYVPLDTAYPSDRLKFMLEDAQITILVSQQRQAAGLPTQRARVVCMDSDAAVLAQQSASNPVSAVTTADLAYVIYTSGSTGKPKGVQITHASLLNLVFWHQHAFAVTPADRATQVTSPSFDATGWELWPYLTTGASVYLPDEDTRVSSTLLRNWLVEQGITISFLPTALAESIMALAWPSTTSLRYLLTGADTLHRCPSSTLPFVLVNNYGPTEATVVATSGHVPPTEHAAGLPSIGRPIDNVQIYILDHHLRQTPVGEPGELYIGGAGLAKGYLNQPELTAERFIPHPFSSEPGARLYKTGDLARYLPDGQIAFLGRTDYQVKIRGYRIEPDEIVSVLNEHPAVQASIVVAREDAPGDKRLVAYIVLVSGTNVTSNSLHDTLTMHLPDYMIPATFVLLESLPLTANGKLDRAALPRPDAINTLRDDVIVEPTTPIEEQLVSIVAPLLGVEHVGIDDNFFLLGGHSLLGTQLISRIAGAFGVTLSLRTLFEAPTARQLSGEIEQLIIAKLEALSDEEVRLLLETTA